MSQDFVWQVELPEALAVQREQFGGERRRIGRDLGIYGPVFFGTKLLDFNFAINDDLERYRLHTAG